jgi:hypothetical protein
LLPALQQFDRRTVGFSLLLYFVAGAELSVIHHMGHNLVCASEGYKFNIWVNPFGGYSTCYGVPENHLLYVTLGPAFGAMAAGVPLLVPRVRRSRVWKIVLVSVLANEALKVPAEMAVQMPSSVPALYAGMLLFQYGVLAILVLTLAKKEKRVAAAP